MVRFRILPSINSNKKRKAEGRNTNHGKKNKRDLCSVESSSATHHIHLRAEPFLLLFKCSDHPLSYPCAKIVATFPEGQSVHNLG
jgi:hypothetical protein